MRKKIEGSSTGSSAEESPQSATERTICNLTAFIYLFIFAFIYFNEILHMHERSWVEE